MNETPYTEKKRGTNLRARRDERQPTEEEFFDISILKDDWPIPAMTSPRHISDALS